MMTPRKAHDLLQAFIDKTTARVTELDQLARAAQSPEFAKAAYELVTRHVTAVNEYTILVTGAIMATANETGYKPLLGVDMETRLANAEALHPEARLSALEKSAADAQAQFVSAAQEIIQRAVKPPAAEATPAAAILRAPKRKRLILA